MSRGLASEGYHVDVVHDGASALTFLEQGNYDVLLLDRDLPILHGDIVARSLRDSGSSVRVLMLTAAAESADQIAGLELGADDYLAKPFDYDVLLARLRALTRRLTGREGGYRRGGLRLSPGAHLAWCDEQPVHLRPKEFAVLAELLRANGDAVGLVALLDAGWGSDVDVDEAVVKTVVHSLRKKVGASRIVTVHGVGYRIA
ncbi:DNA-binding response OmpR family regulator [Leifsonia shinshuensis]|uniref:DNA-binding response OmpR family regulator n=1 Tax=Leifsonia shinshuensis TaxID=150026 RepID=A0A853CVZ2_9MICO|nr:DNA-binding response OmpR family regulator [Leifsonia shinshuensis]